MMVFLPSQGLKISILQTNFEKNNQSKNLKQLMQLCKIQDKNGFKV